MRRLATFSHDHRRAVLGLWIAFVVSAGALGATTGGTFINEFSLPNTESQRALDLLQSRFPAVAGDQSQIVLRAERGKLTDPGIRARAERVLAQVRPLPGVAGVESPFAGGGTLSRDGRTAIAALSFDKQADDLDREDVLKVIDVAEEGAGNGLGVALGGQAIQFARQPEGSGTELIGIGVAVVVLFLALGSFVAMGIPLLTAALSLIAAVSLTAAMASLFSVADFATQLAIMIGLGVGIDYGLLIITRFRGERGRGQSVREATLTAIDTAGRAVFFAGVTVVIALLGMLLLGLSFLRGPSVAAALAVTLTMLATLSLLPALLGFWGKRIKVSASKAGHDEEPRLWARLSHFIDRRPVVTALGALLVLLVIAAPATHLRLGSSDAGGDKVGTTTRAAYDWVSEGFGAGANGPLLVVAELGDEPGAGSLERLRSAIGQAPGVAGAGAPRLNPEGDTAVLTAVAASKPQDAETERTLERLRDDTIPPIAKATGLRVSIGGATATQADFDAVLADKLPPFVLVVVGLSLLLLTAVFRSVVVPIKAALMTVLSFAATLGAVTFVFQDGHLASLIGLESPGPIESFLPVFLFSIVFGLSMDYEVFLLSRVHEEWTRGGDARYAVRHGLATTGRVIFAAALIMISVFGTFMLGDDRVIKLFGFGLAIAVFIDAFIIRLLLVPAVMRLLGETAWWLPRPLGRILPHISVEGPSPPEAEQPAKS